MAESNPTPETGQTSGGTNWISDLGNLVNVAANASTVYWGFTNNPGYNPHATGPNASQGGAFPGGGMPTPGGGGMGNMLVFGGILLGAGILVAMTRKK